MHLRVVALAVGLLAVAVGVPARHQLDLVVVDPAHPVDPGRIAFGNVQLSLKRNKHMKYCMPRK